MAKNPYPIEFIQLEDRHIQLFLKRGNAPLNLTGATVTAEVHDVELSLVSALTVTIVNAVNGEILISPPVGGMIKAGRFVWDALISVGINSQYLPMSTCTVHPSLTRLIA